jgi:hypothetical protein
MSDDFNTIINRMDTTICGELGIGSKYYAGLCLLRFGWYHSWSVVINSTDMPDRLPLNKNINSGLVRKLEVYYASFLSIGSLVTFEVDPENTIYAKFYKIAPESEISDGEIENAAVVEDMDEHLEVTGLTLSQSEIAYITHFRALQASVEARRKEQRDKNKG